MRNLINLTKKQFKEICACYDSKENFKGYFLHQLEMNAIASQTETDDPNSGNYTYGTIARIQNDYNCRLINRDGIYEVKFMEPKIESLDKEWKKIKHKLDSELLKYYKSGRLLDRESKEDAIAPCKKVTCDFHKLESTFVLNMIKFMDTIMKLGENKCSE